MSDSTGSSKDKSKKSKKFQKYEPQTPSIPKKSYGKKNQISLNHLIHYESYKDLDEYKNRHKKSKPRRQSRNSFNDYSPDRYKVPLTGLSFINLNYKFIVDQRGNYKPQELDPNIPVSLDNIIRIIAPTGNSCPICLSDKLVAPRMITACGHILCLKCLLSLLDTEIPKFKKTESAAVIEKYNDCPLCSTIIRKKDVKPVLAIHTDERFETPKIGDDVIMSLMSRPFSKLFAVPRSIEGVLYQIDNFPFVDMKDPDLSQYLRLFKAGLPYILKMYNEEKQEVLKSFEEDKLLYNDDGKYHFKAIEDIDKDIEFWTSSYNSNTIQPHQGELIVKKEEINPANSYFYYEAGFNARSTFVLSPLDIKVLKANYNNSYFELPSNVIARVENIQYEELTPENSLKKYKYLSHLPLGTTIGFIQCNWFKNEYISQDTWEAFKSDLTKRTKKSQKKLQREDRDKKRAENEEERRTRLFFERENDPTRQNRFNDDYEDYNDMNFGSLSITDNRLPVLPSHETIESDSDDLVVGEPSKFETTVWGTKVKKNETAPDEIEEDDWDPQEMIRKAKEEMDKQEQTGQKKKKKKKLVLLSSNY